MKKALLVVVFAIVMVAWFLMWFRDKGAVNTSVAQPWPGEMGALNSAANRWPKLKANDASVKLMDLAKAVPKNEGVDGFVEREIAQAELDIGEPPALADVSAIRELLLHEPIVWESNVEFDNTEVGARRPVLLTVARALVASALGKARRNDATAWEDLHAVWKLARSLDDHPQMMSQTAVLTMARMINGVAWKMPLPAPAWFGELQGRDHVRTLLDAFQYQAASYANEDTWFFPTRWLAGSVDRDRRIAEALFNETKCDVSTVMNDLGTDLTSIWRRAFRYRAEREATANSLRAREGKPIETSSRCSDGGWTFDGTTLRFSREIATAAPDKPMPLVLRVKP